MYNVSLISLPETSSHTIIKKCLLIIIITVVLWTPWGHRKVSCIERCLLFRGKFELDIQGVLISECPLREVPLYIHSLSVTLDIASFIFPQTVTSYPFCWGACLSFLLSLPQNNIPVLSPAITDGAIGDMMYMQSYKNPGLIIDIAQGK